MIFSLDFSMKPTINDVIDNSKYATIIMKNIYYIKQTINYWRFTSIIDCFFHLTDVCDEKHENVAEGVHLSRG